MTPAMIGIHDIITHRIKKKSTSVVDGNVWTADEPLDL